MKYLLLLIVIATSHCTSLDQNNPIDKESSSYIDGNEIDSDSNGVADYYDKLADSDEDGVANINDPDSKWYTEISVVDTDDTSNSGDSDEPKKDIENDDSVVVKKPGDSVNVADSSEVIDDTTSTETPDDTTTVEKPKALFYYENHTSFNPEIDSLSRVIVSSDEGLDESKGYTLFSWLYIDNDTEAGSVILERTFQKEKGIMLHLSVQNDGIGLFKLNLDMTPVDNNFIKIPLERDKWYFLAITAKTTGTTLSIFDTSGTPISSTQNDLTLTDISSESFTFGYLTQPEFFGEYKFLGKINGFGITSKTLETDEIIPYLKNDLYSSSTVFYYPLDEGSGSTFTDEINGTKASGYTEW